MAKSNGVGRRELFRNAAMASVAAAFAPGSARANESTPPAVRKALRGDLQAPPEIGARPGTDKFWRQVRRAFVLPDDYIHMNTGTTGSPPAFVLENLAVYGARKALDPRDWEKVLNADFPDLFPLGSSIFGPSAVAARQAQVAAAYGANADEIVLSYDTTDACNLIFAGTPWAPGDRIVTTSMEHLALQGPMAWARDHHGVQLAVIDIPSTFSSRRTVEEVVGWFTAELRKPLASGAKQYVAFSEVFYKNGLRLPVAEICAAARSFGAYSIIDTAHGWGMLPVDCHAYGADFIAGAGHKWLCGGPGTGICYVRSSGANLPPFAMGNFFLYGLPNPFVAPSAFYGRRDWPPAAYMQLRGETNTPALYAMTDSLAFFQSIGLGEISQRGLSLATYMRRRVVERWGPNALWVADHPDARFKTALVSFNPFRGKDDPAQFATLNAAISTILAALAAETPKAYVRSTTWRDRSSDPADNRVGFRISTHGVYVDYDQVDWVLQRLAAHVDASGLPQLCG
jgi:selenocysteine lyase/cysteine desulfurase